MAHELAGEDALRLPHGSTPVGQVAAEDQGKSKSYSSPELDTEAQLSKKPDTPLPEPIQDRQPEPWIHFQPLQAHKSQVSQLWKAGREKERRTLRGLGISNPVPVLPWHIARGLEKVDGPTEKGLKTERLVFIDTQPSLSEGSG